MALPPARGRHVAEPPPPPAARPVLPVRPAAGTTPGRAAGAVLLSALLPGSGHLLLGHRRSGRAILAVSVPLLLLALAVLAVAYVDPRAVGETVGPYLVRPGWIRALRWAALALGAAWVLVVLSAGWLAARGGRAATRATAGLLAVAMAAAVGVPAVQARDLLHTTDSSLEEIFPSGTEDWPDTAFPGRARPPSLEESFADDRLNVLLIGGDAGDNRVGLRTDTVILASVDISSGRTLLFSLPRNLQRVPFPPGSPMAEQWPDGFDCGTECLLNAVWPWAEERPELFPGDPQPGLTALRGAVSETLGLPVEYYALVDLGGFRSIIDALGGVTIRVTYPVPIGGGTSPIKGYIEPGLRRLDGYEALWYARSRAESDDYQRIDRQRCLLGALAREADPVTVLRNYQQVAASTKDAVETDIPRDLLPDLVRLGFRVKEAPIQGIAFGPPVVPSTADPDFDRIRALVQKAIADSEAAAAGAGDAGDSSDTGDSGGSGAGDAGDAGEDTGDEPAPAPSPAPADRPVELSEVCAYE